MKTSRKSGEDAELLAAGEKVISLFEERNLNALEELDSYIVLFSQWEEALKGMGVESSRTPPSFDITANISQQHARIISLAENMKDEVAESLKSLKRRGRGLRAYADHFPKRISTIRTRRG